MHVRTWIAVVSVLTIAVGGWAVPATATHSTAVAVVDNDFDPETIYVRAGDTVVWSHEGTSDHTVTSDDGSGESFDSGVFSEGDSDFTHQFNNVGSFPYHCNFHNGMTGTVEVVAADAEPSISINDRSLTEGDSGDRTASFTVSLSFDTDEVVTVDYTTNDGTATGGSDYTGTAGTLTFDSGVTTRTIGVTVHGDTEVEDDETFTVDLSDAFNATMGDGQGIGTINDDDPAVNQPPQADAGGPYATAEGEPLTLDGSGSGDPDGAIASYEWDLDGDGTVDATDVRPSTTYDDDGTVQVTLTVTDGDGRSDSDTATVEVADGAVVFRSSGPDRVATTIAASRDHWGQADDAIVATARDFPDALAAGPLAAELDAPLLLTEPTVLPEEVEEELARLGPIRVWLLGGTAAISQGVEDRLQGLGYSVRRLEGPDRFSTARAIALEVGPSPTGHVTLALGQHVDPSRDSWPDALAAGSLSASPDRVPTLLTASHTLPGATEDALGQLGASKVFLVGGTAAVSDGVRDRLIELGYDVERLAGASRYATGTAVAENALARHALGDVPVVFATGLNFPDGLAAGALAARIDGVVVLVPSGHVPDEIAVFLRDHADRFDVGVVVGGDVAVSQQTLQELQTDMTA